MTQSIWLALGVLLNLINFLISGLWAIWGGGWRVFGTGFVICIPVSIICILCAMIAEED